MLAGSVGVLWGPYGGRLGCSGAPMGVAWGALGPLWGSIGVPLGPYGGRLGCSKAPVEVDWGALGSLWGSIGVLWGSIGVHWGAYGGRLGSYGGRLGCSGALLGSTGVLWHLYRGRLGCSGPPSSCGLWGPLGMLRGCLVHAWKLSKSKRASRSLLRQVHKKGTLSGKK